jgi:hypothetical protein
VEQNEAESASTLLNHITHHIRWAWSFKAQHVTDTKT